VSEDGLNDLTDLVDLTGLLFLSLTVHERRHLSWNLTFVDKKRPY